MDDKERQSKRMWRRRRSGKMKRRIRRTRISMKKGGVGAAAVEKERTRRRNWGKEEEGKQEKDNFLS